jgi:hypothetical protein
MARNTKTSRNNREGLRALHASSVSCTQIVSARVQRNNATRFDTDRGPPEVVRPRAKQYR